MVTTSQIILFKSCNKCGGDLYHNQDHYGAYWQCLQCAYLVEDDSAERTRRQKPCAGANPFR
jgi:DNA-directed RNA polymerase subunit M/transcription elongation factor TFIIS